VSTQGVPALSESSEVEANMRENCLVMELRAVAEIAARAAVAAENGLCAEDVRKRTTAVSRRVLPTARESSGNGEPRHTPAPALGSRL
jgi:hypothetical protein